MSEVARLVALNLVDHPLGGSQLGVIAKRTYRVQSGRCVVAEEQIPLVEDVIVSEDKTALLHDLDSVLNRTQVDLIIRGNAYAYRKRNELEVEIRVGSLERRIAVVGDRRAYRDASHQLSFSRPAAFEVMPLDRTAAYGGVDLVALRKYGDPLEKLMSDARLPYDPRLGSYAYPRNRAGKGYLIEPSDEALAACMLPNLEVPSHRLTPETLAVGHPARWPAGPLIAATGYLGYQDFPRCAMLGMVPPFDEKACPIASFAEVRMGVLNPKSIAARVARSERMDIAVAQQSSLGMRMAAVEPGAPVQLEGVHPSLPSWSFSLSRETPRFALKLPDGPPQQLVPKIRCVSFEPEQDRVCVTWVGEHREPRPVGPVKFAKTMHAVSW